MTGLRFFLVALVVLAGLVSACGGETSGGGTITTVVGTGVSGTEGVGGPAAEAQLRVPVDLAFDPDGNMYVAERYGSRIVKIDAAGILTVLAGTGESSFSGDGGPAAAAALNGASAVATDSKGNVYIADTLNNRIRMVDRRGVITTVAGTGTAGLSGDGGPATAARLKAPGGMTIDSAGNLYVNDLGNLRIRKVDRNGTITTVAGTGLTFELSPDGTPAGEAGIGYSDAHFPIGLEFDAEGRLHFTDLAFNRIRFIDADGLVQTAAGNGDQGSEGDGGAATEASLYSPLDIAFAPDGRLFVTTHDHGAGTSSRVRVVDENGSISTVVGTGETGYEGDGGPAVDSELDIPAAVAIGPDGNLYIADANNNVIRKVEL